MANKPIELEFVANVASYLRDVKKASVSTEDVAEALVAVTNSSDDLERKLGRAMRDAAKDTEILERAIKEIPKAADDAADKVERDFDRMGDNAREAGRDTADSFRGSFAEGLASGDLSEVFTETLGEVVSSLKGPVGVAAGVIAAGGLLVFNEFRKHAEAMKAAVEETSTAMWSTFVKQAGDAFGVIDQTINTSQLVSAEFRRLWEDDPKGMKELVKQARLLGISATDIVLARAGDEAAIGRVQIALEKAKKAGEENVAVAFATAEAQGAVEDALVAGGTSLRDNIELSHAYNESVSGLPDVWSSVEVAIDKVATSTEGVVDEATKAKIVAADINADGFLDDTEVAKANLGEIMTRAGLIPDPGLPKTLANIQQIKDILAEITKHPKEVTVRVNAQLAGNAGSQLTGSLFGSQFSQKFGTP